MKRFICGALLFFTPFLAMAAPVGGCLALCERAVITGHTDLTTRGKQFPTEDNYGVFEKSRHVYIVTGLYPIWLTEQDGKVIRVGVLMNRTLPVKFYSPATVAETALYRKHFS